MIMYLTGEKLKELERISGEYKSAIELYEIKDLRQYTGHRHHQVLRIIDYFKNLSSLDQKNLLTDLSLNIVDRPRYYWTLFNLPRRLANFERTLTECLIKEDLESVVKEYEELWILVFKYLPCRRTRRILPFVHPRVICSDTLQVEGGNGTFLQSNILNRFQNIKLLDYPLFIPKAANFSCRLSFSFKSFPGRLMKIGLGLMAVEGRSVDSWLETRLASGLHPELCYYSTHENPYSINEVYFDEETRLSHGNLNVTIDSRPPFRPLEPLKITLNFTIVVTGPKRPLLLQFYAQFRPDLKEEFSVLGADGFKKYHLGQEA